MSDPWQDFIEWLDQGDRTYGWGCLVAMDRNRINTLLVQKYVSDFSSGSYLPPFNETIITSDVTAELIYDYTLDCPRLSFENATISDSRARLRMKVVGGSQLSVEQHQDGSPRLARISAIDVLNGPVLHMNLAINRMPGLVSAGKMVLNIAEGGDFEMSFADTVEQRRLSGAYFQKKFEALDDDKKIFVLGEVGIPDGSFLKPADFKVRTHGKPGDPQAGAVLLLIRMEGDGNGSEPPSDADMRYLLDNGLGYSFIMLVARELMVKKYFVPACEKITHSSSPFVGRMEVSDVPGQHYLHATSGAMARYSLNTSTSTFSDVTLDDIRLPLSSFTLDFTSSTTLLTWSGLYTTPVKFVLRSLGWSFTGQVTIEFFFKRSYRMHLKKVEGLVEIREQQVSAVNTCTIKLVDQSSFPSPVSKFNSEVGPFLRDQVIARTEAGLQQFLAALTDIPCDQMVEPLFGEGDNVHLEKFGFSRDLALHGKVLPLTDVFVVSPMEFAMGPGQVKLFVTYPLRSVTWKVENPEGESGPVGTINALGLYTSPRDLPSRYIRVKVSATDGASGYTSSALVTVLASAISISPQVMVHSAGSSRGREMRAGTRGSGALDWEVVDPASGARIVPSEDPEGDHTYFPGPVLPNTSFSIDQIKVSSGWDSQLAYVLVTHHPLAIIVKSQRIGSGDTVQLTGYSGGTEIPAQMRREWKVLLGAGSVDPTSGVFTPGGESPWLFSIVTLKVWLSEAVQADGYILLPIPYVELSEIDWTPADI